MAGLYTGAPGLWGGLPGLISSTTLSTPPSLLADVGGIAATGANLALWFDTNQAYKSSGGGIVTPDSILTYTAPSPKLVYGSDGVLGYANHNLLTYSQDFDNAAWTKTATTVTANAIAAPDGTLTADLIIPTAVSTTHFVTRSSGTSTGFTYTWSVYAKAGGYNFLRIGHSGGLAPATCIDLTTGLVSAGAAVTVDDAGNGWWKISGNGTTTGASSLFYSVNHVSNSASTTYVGDGVSGIYVWGAEVKLGTAVQTYIPTTTAAVYSLPRDHNPTTGAALGVLVEEARTNLALRSNDFTNAAWVKSNLTAAKTATGPDGVANSASTLTATAANATARQDITSASAARITSMFVKRRTGTGAVTLSQGEVTGSELLVAGSWSLSVNGGTGTATESPSGTLNLTGDATNPATADQSFSTVVGTVYRIGATVATNTASLSVGTTQGGTDNFTATVATGTPTATAMIFVATATTTWVRFFKTQAAATVVSAISCKAVVETTVTVTSSWTRVATASATITNPIVLVKLATSGDAIDVALFQIENGGFITSPIPTVASQVTRAADQVSILTSAFPYSATAGTIAVVARPILANSLGAAVSLNDGSGNEEIVLYRDASGNLVYQVEDGGANQLDPLDSGQNAANLTEYKMAAAWAANDFATAVGGNAAVTDTSGTLPTVTTLEVGVNQANNYVNGHIKRVDYYAVRKTDAELQVLST